jgi:AraC-like DNA-binding protein
MDKGVLYFWSGRALFVGPSTDAAAHRHHSLQIGVGLNKPFRLFADQRWTRCRTALIEPNRLHQLDGRGDWQAILLLDPESTSAQRLMQHYLRDRGLRILVDALPERVLDELRELVSTKLACPEADALYDRVITALVDKAHSPKRAHPKVRQVLAYLHQLPVKKVSLEEIAATVYLSESRIIHLFKEQTGIPIRRYLLWLRLIEALKAIFSGASFTAAAHETGFSDSAHLSRTFKQMFGLTLSELFKNSQFVQAIPCLPLL